MSDDVWKRQEIESPCVKLCTIHPEAQLCIGCLRSIDEIMGWSKLSGAERRDIMAVLPDRRSRVQKRRGGRSARVPQG